MLIGQIVRLRGIEREDLPAFVRWLNDPEVRHHLLLFKPLSTVEEERWYEAHLESKDEFVFTIEARRGEDWRPIGAAGLLRIDQKNGTAIFGIFIGDKACWGQGLGTDATRTLLRFAFHELNLHRVELEVFEYNVRGIRCYEKVGFRREGIRRQALFRDGRRHDALIMSILRPEFDETVTGVRG